MKYDHFHVNYVEIGEDGKETWREGHYWADGPRLGSQWATWVLIEPARAGIPLAVAVVRASRRHRIGRVVRGRWKAKAGRYVDKGTWYREVHPKSPTGALTVAPMVFPMHIPTVPLSDVIMWVWSGLCQRCGAEQLPNDVYCAEHSR
jgi:hypothetical protein